MPLSPWQGAHDPRISLLRAVPCPSLCHQVGALPMPVSPHRATMALAQPSPWCVMCQGWPSSVGWPLSPQCHPPTRKPRVTPVCPAGTPLRGAGPHNGTHRIVCVSGTVPLSLEGTPGIVKGIGNSFRRNSWGQKRSVLKAQPWDFPRGSAVALTPNPNLSVILQLQENESLVAPRPINGFWGVALKPPLLIFVPTLYVHT